MIDILRANAYCSEDISNIENYQIAINSQKVYVVHHRRETDENLSVKQLKEMNLYYHRPAVELIFLDRQQHILVHKPAKGTKRTAEQRRFISEQTKKGMSNRYVLSKISRPVQQITKNGQIINTYPSTREARRQTGIAHIDDVARGQRKYGGGYIWKYV